MDNDTEDTILHREQGPSAVPGAGGMGEPATKAKTQGKAKPDIETLEQFIRHAYGRKGQHAPLKEKVATRVAQRLSLDDEALCKLYELADGDILLAVPRQLLLAANEVEGLPALRAALDSFVSGVMQRHRAYAKEGVKAAVMNLPEGPSMAMALREVARYVPDAGNNEARLKPSELEALRRNATYLLALWFVRARGIGADEASAMLFSALWKPAAKEVDGDSGRLRAITGLEQGAEVAIVCDRYIKLARDAKLEQDQAQREASRLRDQLDDLDQRVARLQGDIRQVQAERDNLRGELAAQREAFDIAIADMKARHGAEQMHLRHDQELLRGRLSRRLGESIEMLEVGLAALRNKNPRAEVMVERAEHVVDAMRVELDGFKEESSNAGG